MLELPTRPWTLAGTSAGSSRDDLARFWLAAPEDLLPSLWSSPVGETTRQLVRELNAQHSFTPDQIALRNAIGHYKPDFGADGYSVVDCQFPLFSSRSS